MKAVTDDDVDPSVPGGRQLRDFASTLSARGDMVTTRERLISAVGFEGASVAAAVCANFHMTNRVLDATGCPVPNAVRSMAAIIAPNGLQLDPY